MAATTSIKKALNSEELPTNKPDSDDEDKVLTVPSGTDAQRNAFTIEQVQEAWDSLSNITDRVPILSAIKNSKLKISPDNNELIVVEVVSSVQKKNLKELILEIAEHVRNQLKNEYINFEFKVGKVKKSSEKKKERKTDEEIFKNMMQKNKNLHNFYKKYKLRIKND
ncbi:MAG: hypothetical protein ACK5IQ_01655 [Bacteroidales bacterium]